MRHRAMTSPRRAVAALLMMGQLTALPAVAGPVATPQVRPVPDNGNLPLNSAVFTGSRDYGDFARHGYVEEEFYISGKASTRDQETGAVVTPDLPYVSRIVVRRPANPKAFSGNVVVEPLHAMLEKSEIWEQTHGYLTRNGDIWVGVTVRGKGADMDIANGRGLGGVPLLQIYDPVRYAPLTLAEDGRPMRPAPPGPTPLQGIDLVLQVGALFKTGGGPLPRGFAVKRTFAVGGGANGEIVSGIVRTGLHASERLPGGAKVFDGYFGAVNNRFYAAPLADAVFAMFQSENETTLEANLGHVGKQPDTPTFRVYYVPGSAHIGSRNANPSSGVQVAALLPDPARGVSAITDSGMCPNINDDPIDVFMAAILARVERAAKDGTPLPPAPPPALAAGDPGTTTATLAAGGVAGRVATLKRDRVTGNVRGGVRLPWLEAPIASYSVPADMFLKRAPGGPAGAPAHTPPGPGAAPASVQRPTDSWPRASKEPVRGARPAPPFCRVVNPRTPFDRATLGRLYRGYDDYVARFAAATANAVRHGWVLPEDAATLRPRGRPEDF